MENFLLRKLSEEERSFTQRKFPKTILRLFVETDVVALYYECKIDYEEEPASSFEFGLLKLNNDTNHLYRVPIYNAKKAQVAESCSREFRRAGIFAFTHSTLYKGNITVYGLRCENVSARQIGGVGTTGFVRNPEIRKALADFLERI